MDLSRLRLDLIWDRVRSSIWSIPLVMLVLGVLLFQIAQVIDSGGVPSGLERTWWLHSGTGADARNLMSTLVTAIITMSSVVFSITIVTLTLAAAQFGSRLIPVYMQDLRTRLALGMFLMTILYCLLALRVVTEAMTPGQVPHVTVTAGLALGMACVVTLLFFLSVVARSIIADEVIRRVARDLDTTIECLPPRSGSARPAVPPPSEPGGALLRSKHEGYVQAIRYEHLAAVAREGGVRLQLLAQPGDFMCEDGWMGWVQPEEKCSAELMGKLRHCVLTGDERTPAQDLRYSIRHLVDVALRALSPGINDANTALVVIDRLRGGLSRLMGKALPDGVFRDDDGEIRLTAMRSDHAHILDVALHQIRHAAARQPVVLAGLLDALEKLAEHAVDADQRDAIAMQARLTAQEGLDQTALPSEQRMLQERLAQVERKLDRMANAAGTRDAAAGARLGCPETQGA